MALAQKNMGSIRDSIRKIKKNLIEIETAISEKKGVKERSLELMKNYGARIEEAKSARKEFKIALAKDRKELSAVQKDVRRTRKKLQALLSAETALEESIRISEESLEKIFGKSQDWRINKSKSMGALQEINDNIKVLRDKKTRQNKLLLEHNTVLKRWMKNYQALEKTLKNSQEQL